MCLCPADAPLKENIQLYNYGILISIDFIPVMKREDRESCQTGTNTG